MTSATLKIFAPRVVAQSGSKCTASAILLHGSGGTGDDIRNTFRILLGEELTFPHIRLIYPTAPVRPYTLAGGLTSHVWFDRSDLGPDGTEQQQSVEAMAAQLGQLIDGEVQSGIPLHRILLGGFSMGGSMSLHLGYRFYPQVAGVLVMSSFLYNDSGVYKALESRDLAARLPPLQQFHGESDDLVCYSWGQHTHGQLLSLGVPGDFVSIPRLGHSINVTMAQAATAWIAKMLPEDHAL